MSFDDRDIRVWMDVYSFDQVYLGTVLKIRRGATTAQERILPDALQTSSVSGELLGPMPTQPLGNSAVRNQSAGAGYATTADARPLGAGELVIGKWWGLLERHVIPIGDVLTVSLERVVLRRRAADLA
ncbi:MAG TPA: hypothetical protein VGD69_11925 [Herpetosiphonaceae bacterium]